MSESGQPDRTGHDLGVAAFFLVWAAVGWVSVATGGLLGGSYGLDPGPALMPVIVLGVLTVGGMALAVRPVMALLSGRGALRVAFRPDWRQLAFYASVAAFPVAIVAVGYIVATLVFVFVWAFVLTPGCLRRPLRTAAVAALAAVVATLVVHGGFDLVIGAQLP